MFRFDPVRSSWDEIGNSRSKDKKMFRTCTLLDQSMSKERRNTLIMNPQSPSQQHASSLVGSPTPILQSRSSSIMDRKRNSTPHRSMHDVTNVSQKQSVLRVNDETISNLRNFNRDKYTVFETHRAMTELKDRYTKSCRDLVSQSRKSPNPRPGPIPARLPLAGVLARQRLQSAQHSRPSTSGTSTNANDR